MPVSEHSLLLIVVFTGAAVTIMLLTTALSSRTEPFLRTWLASVVTSLVGAFTSAIFYMDKRPWMGAASFGLLTVAFGLKAVAAYQFRTGRLPLLVATLLILTATFAVVASVLSGYDGLAIILWQGWGAACCATAAANYKMGGAEAPLATTILAFFYFVLGASYGISAVLILMEGKLVLGGPPENWADQASRLIAALAFIGIGSVLLVLNQRQFRAASGRPSQPGLMACRGHRTKPPGRSRLFRPPLSPPMVTSP